MANNQHYPNIPRGEAQDHFPQDESWESAPYQTYPPTTGDAYQPTPNDAYRSVNDGGYQAAGPEAYPPGGNGAYRPITVGRSGRSGGSNQYGGSNQHGAPKKHSAWRIVFIVALIVLIAALIALGAIFYSYWQGQQMYDELADENFEAPDTDGASLADFVVDWDALRAINPDVVAWVYMPDTEINYPVVHTTDNEYYLTHDFEGSEGFLAQYGTIFLSAENRADFSDTNSVLFGHNMRDGSMFATITGLSDEQEFFAHRTIYVLTPNGNYQLKTFSLEHVSVEDEDLSLNFSSDETRTAYIQQIMDKSVHTVTDVPSADEIEKLFTFSTCDSITTEGRYALFAYVVDSTVDGEDAGVASEDDVAAVEEATEEIAS